ncbi:MAG TPA: 4-(cytidine 5'-diphospho)-2-C-methyl-D-erythritol kinase [Alphaproteobacteria bacterium]|nr:4-(cytidine 5'-diphospho)-2-C-methyl-D-erythritol kinase [Alphaproteobacteria bacterium]
MTEGGGPAVAAISLGAAQHESAPAKLNLFLHVLGRRESGHHLLDSLVAFTDLGDALAAGAPNAGDPDAITLDVEGPFGTALARDAGDRNLVLRAARLLRKETGVTRGCHLRLLKRLPLAAGLGGGSADAAAALRALARFWGLDLPRDRFEAIALSLGADVPACFASRPARMGGIGERLTSMQLPETGVVLANPGTPLSTAAVFEAYARLREERSASYRRPLAMIPAFADVHTFAEWLDQGTDNDLTEAAVRLEPAIADALIALSEMPGALMVRMSGSGATCFALFPDAESAAGGARWLAGRRPQWWIAATALVPALDRPLPGEVEPD